VMRHPSPPSVQVFGETHSLEGGPDRTPQPFTTSVGTSTRGLM
jgi:hypothetical protein